MTATSEIATRLVGTLVDSGRTLALAESLTGGMLADAVVSVPGASAVFRGAVVAYSNDVKNRVLSVPAALLAERGAIDPEVASVMALGAVRLLGADIGIATTGVAGPDSPDDTAVGTVFIAVLEGATGVELVRGMTLTGDRGEIREKTVLAAFGMLEELLTTAQ